MYSKSLALAALVSTAVAQQAGSLTSVLAGQPSLSNLTGYLAQLPQFSGQLGSLSNVTLLAPNNDAFTAFLNSSTAGALASDQQLIQGILR